VRARPESPLPGIQVVTPPLLLPRRHGGHRVLARWLRRALADVEVLWVNDPVAGVGALRSGVPAVYDVTDDWREMVQAPADRRRLVAAEDALAGVARTVVCSEVLAQRWMTRYGVEAIVIQNGVDVAAIGAATPRRLAGSPPHAVYVGTVHTNRIDVDLVAELADRFPGTVHLVGPDYLDAGARGRLRARGVLLDGPAPASEVPSWLVSADVLICPHVVDGFTLSLDAIKSHEYLATDRPVVATPSSGFQSLSAPGLAVVDRTEFSGAVGLAIESGAYQRYVATDWATRASEFSAVLLRVVGRS
jgi:glycosyltransferase involved in cell wall biosynthesis